MTKHFLTINIIVFLFLCYSCKPSPQKAEKYYDDIIQPVENVFDKEDELISVINSERDTANNDSVSIISDIDTAKSKDFIRRVDLAFSNLKIQVSVSKNKIDALPDFDKKNILKQAAQNILDEYADLCDHEYSELITIVKIPKEEYSSEDDDNFFKLSETIDNKLQEKMTALITEIKLFAQEYNFEIQHDSLQTIDNQGNSL